MSKIENDMTEKQLTDDLLAYLKQLDKHAAEVLADKAIISKGQLLRYIYNFQESVQGALTAVEEARKKLLS